MMVSTTATSSSELRAPNGRRFQLIRAHPDRSVYSRHCNVTTRYDKRAGADTWKSITRSTHARPQDMSKGGAGGEFSSAFHLTAHDITQNPAALDEYRKRWAREGESAASRRFTSQFNRSVNKTVTKEHQVRVTRRLPGVPKPVEEFRNKIAERGGMNGIRAIARIFRIIDDSGDRRLSRVEFKNCLTDYGLSFTETVRAGGTSDAARVTLLGSCSNANRLSCHTGIFLAVALL